jgi:hypothetical protein
MQMLIWNSAVPWWQDLPFNNSNPKLVPELQAVGGDVTLGILTTNTMFMGESDDFLFGTRRTLQKADCGCNFIPEQHDRVWMAQPFSPFACAEQHQICNPTNGRCTPPMGLYTMLRNHLLDTQSNNSRYLALNDAQLSTAVLVTSTVEDTALSDLLTLYGGDSMLVQDYRLLSTSSASNQVPSNQTQQELHNWVKIQLAHLQWRISDLLNEPTIVLNSTDSGLSEHIKLVEKAIEATGAAGLCGGQRARDARYQTYSFAGILFTLCLGLFIILLSIFIEPLAGWARRWLKFCNQGNVEWRTGELLHLQRKSCRF